MTVDAAGLCVKGGNATILRGGSEAINCNRALAQLVKEGLATAVCLEQAVPGGGYDRQSRRWH